MTTKDFKSYSQAAVFYDGGFNVIDATVVQDGQQFVMIVKDETELPAAKKHLRIATSTKAAGPYSAASPAFTKAWVEGPTVLKVNQDWIVYYDEYRDHRYGALKTRNWRTSISASGLKRPKGAPMISAWTWTRSFGVCWSASTAPTAVLRQKP